VLLAGDYPFMKTADDMKNPLLKNNLENAKYEYGITWRGRGITSDARKFVAGCLHKNPQERWSAKQALDFLKETWVPKLEEKERKEAHAHAEFMKKRSQDKQIKNDEKPIMPPTPSKPERRTSINLQDVARFCECGIFKKTVLITMANTMDRAEVGDLQELFLLLDTNNTGTLSLEELKIAFEQLNVPDVSDEEMKKLFKGIDHDGSGQIHYTELLAAFAESHGLVSMDRLADAFDRIDADGKGYIDHEDLKKILGKEFADEEVVKKMIEEADFKKNGRVDYEELLQLMFGEESDDEENEEENFF